MKSKASKTVRGMNGRGIPPASPENLFDRPEYWLGQIVGTQSVVPEDLTVIPQPDQLAAKAAAFDRIRSIIERRRNHYHGRFMNDRARALKGKE